MRISLANMDCSHLTRVRARGCGIGRAVQPHPALFEEGEILFQKRAAVHRETLHKLSYEVQVCVREHFCHVAYGLTNILHRNVFFGSKGRWPQGHVLAGLHRPSHHTQGAGVCARERLFVCVSVSITPAHGPCTCHAARASLSEVRKTSFIKHSLASFSGFPHILIYSSPSLGSSINIY